MESPCSSSSSGMRVWSADYEPEQESHAPCASCSHVHVMCARGGGGSALRPHVQRSTRLVEACPRHCPEMPRAPSFNGVLTHRKRHNRRDLDVASGQRGVARLHASRRSRRRTGARRRAWNTHYSQGVSGTIQLAANEQVGVYSYNTNSSGNRVAYYPSSTCYFGGYLVYSAD